MCRQGSRWKPATRESNRSALRNHILPFFGTCGSESGREAGLRGVRIHDARHTDASQGVMNGVG